ncbi:MAG: hypothetical protein KH230_15845 [Enterocloster asparagiformis]|nr:hypothetical protein [Enterocloster asparagiformis]
MNQFIIATHATLAGGFADVIRFFKSDLENVRFINAYVESQEFEKELRKCLGEVQGEPVVVLTDILGGSVNQVATKLMGEYGYQLITGINLPLLLELVFIPDPIAPERIEEIVRCAREQIIFVNGFAGTSDEAGTDDSMEL